MGLEGTYPPFSFRDENGKLTGFEVEFAQALAQHGREGEPEADQMGRHAGVAGLKRIDVVINQVTISDERKKSMISPCLTPFPVFRR